MSKYILPLFRDPEVKIVQTFFFKHFLPSFEQVPISIEKSNPNFTVLRDSYNAQSKYW